MSRLLHRLRDFARREVVLVVALVAAAASCAAVPFDAAYAGYIDWRTIALLFCLMATVAGFRALGVLDAAGRWLASRAASPRALAASFTGLAFLASMAVTNDVALITFMPLALTALRAAGMEGSVCILATLMTVAANLGSMLTPIGNPQNLYLFTTSGMTVADFVQLMLPYTLVSAVLLAVCVAVCFRRASCGGENFPTVCAKGRAVSPQKGKRARFVLLTGLFLLCVLSVARAVDVRVTLACVVAVVAAIDRKLFKRVDYALLFTFIALFVFVGNMARVPFVHAAVAGLADKSVLLAAVASSQVISNVPAAVLLSGFTDRVAELVVGVNIGGLGTLIASMASLIAFKAVSIGNACERGHYIKVFTLVNVGFLVVLLGAAAVLGA